MTMFIVVMAFPAVFMAYRKAKAERARRVFLKRLGVVEDMEQERRQAFLMRFDVA